VHDLPVGQASPDFMPSLMQIRYEAMISPKPGLWRFQKSMRHIQHGSDDITRAWTPEIPDIHAWKRSNDITRAWTPEIPEIHAAYPTRKR
jgi:hypothetical protein